MKTANWGKVQSVVGTAVQLFPFVGFLACRKMLLDQIFDISVSIKDHTQKRSFRDV